jgi:AcrR family transcriptional regulator
MSGEPDSFFRKQPRQSRSRAMVTAVLDAADQLLRAGLPNAPLERVASRAGVGIGSLYDYFANANGVWGAVIERLTAENFARLEQVVRDTEDLPLKEAAPRILDAALETYLASPAHTRGVMIAVFRLGWLTPIIRERDRFAALLARRVRRSVPSLSEREAELRCEVLCDAVMGVALSELWRERTPKESAAVRTRVAALLESWVDGLES